MKTLPLLILSLIFLMPLRALCQYTSTLDLHNGFSNLNFSSSLKDLQKAAHLKKVSASHQEEVYTVKNLDDYKIYGYTAQFINLYLYKGKLYEIEVKIPDQHDLLTGRGLSDFILSQVRSEYGNPTSMDTSYQTRMLQKRTLSFWSGSEVTLINARPMDRIILSTNPAIPPTFISETWYFMKNDVANARQNELHTSNGL